MRTTLAWIPLLLAACTVSDQVDLGLGDDVGTPAEAPEVTGPAAPDAPDASDAQVTTTYGIMDRTPEADGYLPDTMVYMSTFARPLAGRAQLRSSTGNAFGGMNTTVCGIDTTTGTTGTDYSMDPYEEEELTDTEGSGVLGITSTGWYVLEPDTYQVTHGGAANPHDARLLRGSVVALHERLGHCQLRFGESAPQTFASDCPDHDGWDVDRDARDIWLAVGGEIVIVDSSGSASTPLRGDRVTVDSARDIVTVGTDGTDTISMWTTGLVHVRDVVMPGPVRQITALPERGLVAVLSDYDNGSVVLLVSEETGDRTWALRSGERLNELSVSPSGRNFAFKRGSSAQEMTDFFRDTSR